MRIVMLSSPASAGPPMAKIVPALAGALERRGHSVAWAAWGAGGSTAARVLRPVTRVGDMVRAWMLTRRVGADAVVVHTAHDMKALLRDLPLVIGLRRLTPRVALVLHGSLPDRLASRPSGLLAHLTRAAYRRADALLVLSTVEANAWRELLPDLSVVRVKNPVERPRVADLPRVPDPDASVVLFVGRLVAGKGCDDLIGAFARLCGERECRLEIAGSGPESQALRRLATDLGVDSDVRFLGHLDADALDDSYARAQVLVLPTRCETEGLPTVLIEAAAAGLPVVTSPVRGALDHFVEGETALFVEPGDARALAASITRVLDDPDLAERMSRALLELAQGFEPDEVAGEYERVLEEVDGR